MKTLLAIGYLAIGLLAVGCTPITMIRTATPGQVEGDWLPDPTPNTKTFQQCKTGQSARGENRNSVEHYKNYTIGYAEFDDQGWGYGDDVQLKTIRQALSQELVDPSHGDDDYLVLVFVHGWHHNAHDNDCNVQEFRQMVRIAYEGTQKAIAQGQLHLARRVFGIYVGWRGESVDAAGLRYTTVIDRRDTAERVAKGSVRQLLADVRTAQEAAQRTRPDKMRTVVIGHSFGGLIAYAAISQGLLNDFTLAGLESPHSCDATEAKTLADTGKSIVWPDGTVLINPAFEATRFEPIQRVVNRRVACTATSEPTKLVVPNCLIITAENDHWTGRYFTIGRALTTLFEGYDRSNAAAEKERQANLHAIGFDPEYETHKLELVSSAAGKQAVVHVLPSMTSVPNTDNPVWVVRAPSSIIDGHNGFLYARQQSKASPVPYLADWLMRLYAKDCAVAPGTVGCTPPP